MQDKNEVFGARHVSEKCACRSCENAVKDKFGRGWRKGYCSVYEFKPNEVYFDGAKCEYYKENRE